jgi:hypothetical protein
MSAHQQSAISFFMFVGGQVVAQIAIGVDGSDECT